MVLPKKPDKAFVQFLDEWAPGKAYKVHAKDLVKRRAGKQTPAENTCQQQSAMKCDRARFCLLSLIV